MSAPGRSSGKTKRNGRVFPREGADRAKRGPTLDLMEQHNSTETGVLIGKAGAAKRESFPSRGAGRGSKPAAVVDPDAVGTVVTAATADPQVGRMVAAALRLKGFSLSGRWMTDRYTKLRNTAWLVRNSRHGELNNPMAIHVLCVEGERLIGEGERLADVLEALCELLIHP